MICPIDFLTQVVRAKSRLVLPEYQKEKLLSEITVTPALQQLRLLETCPEHFIYLRYYVIPRLYSFATAFEEHHNERWIVRRLESDLISHEPKKINLVDWRRKVTSYLGKIPESFPFRYQFLLNPHDIGPSLDISLHYLPILTIPSFIPSRDVLNLRLLELDIDNALKPLLESRSRELWDNPVYFVENRSLEADNQGENGDDLVDSIFPLQLVVRTHSDFRSWVL